MINPEGFDALIRQAQAGDATAVSRLLERIRPCLETFCRESNPSDSVSGSDVVQEAWVRAWQKLEQFRGGETDEQTAAAFYVWLRQIARRTGVNLTEARHAQRRRPSAPLVPVSPDSSSSEHHGVEPIANSLSPSQVLGAREEADRVHAAIRKIDDPDDREIIRLRFFEGLSLQQIASTLNLSYDKVRERFHRTMRALEDSLES